MSFDDWVNFDWIRREPPSKDEVRSLLGVVDRYLHDADVEAISDDLRFTAAFQAALTAANLALRASGYRALTGPGHHQHVAESLELTVGAEAAVIRKMRAFSKKREYGQLRYGREHRPRRRRGRYPICGNSSRHRGGMAWPQTSGTPALTFGSRPLARTIVAFP